MAAGDTTVSGNAGAGADASDEKSKGPKQSLQGGPEEKEYAAIDIIDKKKLTDRSEKVR